jgi:hypothetical protein
MGIVNRVTFKFFKLSLALYISMQVEKILTIVLVLLIFLASGYIYIQQDIIDTADKIIETIELLETKIIDFSLLPPSVEMALIGSVANPTRHDLRVTIYADLFADEVLVTKFCIKKICLPAKSSTMIEIPLYLNTTSIESGFSRESETYISGLLYVESRVLFYTVEKTKIFNNKSLGNLEDIKNLTCNLE